MTSARNRAAALRKRDVPEPAAEETPAPATRPAPAKKVRQTVDLTGERHQELATWRLETAVALGRTRLTTQDVLAAFVDVLLDDPSVARRVRARLEQDDQ